jgi:hypothetical protein
VHTNCGFWIFGEETLKLIVENSALLSYAMSQGPIENLETSSEGGCLPTTVIACSCIFENFIIMSLANFRFSSVFKFCDASFFHIDV